MLLPRPLDVGLSVPVAGLATEGAFQVATSLQRVIAPVAKVMCAAKRVQDVAFGEIAFETNAAFVDPPCPALVALSRAF